MAVDTEMVEKIAHLARLSLAKDELNKYCHDLNGIFEWIAQLEAVDVENVQPLAHPLEVSQRLRVDEVAAIDQRDYFQKLAPQVVAGLYLVPQVIE